MKNLFKALADFQQEVPVIHKGTKGYGYSYADLPTIFEVINPLLKKHGLGFTQELDGGALVTTIFHCDSGEWRASRVDIPMIDLKGMNAYQSFGSGVTYYRRYALSSALGLITDVDNDAHGEQTKKKPTLSQLRFQSGLDKVNDGKLTLKQFQEVCDKYELTDVQSKSLMLLSKIEK